MSDLQMWVETAWPINPCMDASTQIHIPTYSTQPPTQPPPKQTHGLKDHPERLARGATAGIETQPSLSVRERHHSRPTVNTFWLTAFTMSGNVVSPRNTM